MPLGGMISEGCSTECLNIDAVETVSTTSNESQNLLCKSHALFRAAYIVGPYTEQSDFLEIRSISPSIS